MTIVLLVPWLAIIHVAMLVLCRHLVRRRHYAFFEAHRRARGKPTSYSHFLFLYASWLDPAMLTAAASRPGYYADQVKCALLYAAGLVPSVLIGLLLILR